MDWATVVWKVVYLAVAAVVTLVVDRGVTRVARRVLDASSIPSASIFVNIIRGVIWAFGLLSVLEPVFGIKATAFVAGMEEGIFPHRAHEQPGDYVSVGGFEGFVTDVNWRSTIVRDRLGNDQVIPNSVLNKTAFTRKGASSLGCCGVDVLVRPDADLTSVSEEVRRLATEALGELADDAFEVGVTFSGFDAYGTRGTVWLHVRPDVAFGAAQDRVTRVLQGRPWLADAAGAQD